MTWSKTPYKSGSVGGAALAGAWKECWGVGGAETPLNLPAPLPIPGSGSHRSLDSAPGGREGGLCEASAPVSSLPFGAAASNTVTPTYLFPLLFLPPPLPLPPSFPTSPSLTPPPGIPLLPLPFPALPASSGLPPHLLMVSVGPWRSVLAGGGDWSPAEGGGGRPSQGHFAAASATHLLRPFV